MSLLHNRRFAKGYVPGFQKTYLSREMTRAMSIDHPIGDPHGGPAFGERNDPISAIVSIGTMFAAGGGFAAAGFSLAGMSLASGLMFAGGALSLLGNITGNKTLSKIGMVAGIAGGLGNLFDIGTQAGGVGELFGLDKAPVTTGAPSLPLAETAPAAAAADVSSSILDSSSSFNPVSQQLTANPFNGLEGAGPGSDLVASSGAFAPGAPAGDVSPLVSTPLNATNAGPGFDPSAPAGPGIAAPAAPMVSNAPQTGAMSYDSFGNPVPAGSPAATMADPTGLAQMQLDANAAAATAPKGFWGGIKDMGASWMKMAKDNPAMALMMGNAITSVGDVLSGKAGAQVDALEAQGQLSRAQADKLRFEMEEYKRKIAQQNSNYANVANPLATWAPPQSQGYTPVATAPTAGIIGGAMQPAG